MGRLRYNKPHKARLPTEALEGLQLNEAGLLIDERTGQVINELGATRFDVAVRALRGELDPPAWAENTDQAEGVLLSALMPWPSQYTFQVVGAPGADREGFISDMCAVIASVCEVSVPSSCIEAKDRLGGKYVSLAVTVAVRAPELVTTVYERLGRDARVRMKF